MALEATHIKFALDFQSAMHVEDMHAYIAGSVYPDSRYVSGIARTETHGDFLLDPSFATDDFRKGWVTHFVCDRAGNRTMDELFSDLSAGLTERGAGTQWWVRATALKVLLDMEVFPTFDIQPYLPIDHAENPRNESLDTIKRYNTIVTDMYRGKSSVTLTDAKKLWIDFNIGSDLVTQVADCVEAYQQDSSIAERVKRLYGRMMEIGEEIVQTKRIK